LIRKYKETKNSEVEEAKQPIVISEDYIKDLPSHYTSLISGTDERY
jgi:hypothetical protein